MRTVLLIAYHYPPLVGSSGIQRTLRFSKYLPEFGWRPIVLTVNARAYEDFDESLCTTIPPECEVVRTQCIDVARHLSIKGRYPGFLAVPDRWASWQISAFWAGLRLIRERGVSAIWSTYPIATAHQIGAALAQRSGVPWIADFRDPMVQHGYPAGLRRWKAFKRIEEQAASLARNLVFVTPSALEMYRSRYPSTPTERFILLENGFDEESFSDLTRTTLQANNPLLLLHSGIVYPQERNPTALFEALGRLAASARIRPGDFKIRFRAPVHDTMLTELAARHGVTAFIETQPPIAYRDALSEMLDADALLVMQGDGCNEQIPAKLYEYLRAGRPILPLTDPAGDTGRTLERLGFPFVTKLESAIAIERIFPEFIASLRDGKLRGVLKADIKQFSRRTQTERLAQLLSNANVNHHSM